MVGRNRWELWNFGVDPLCAASLLQAGPALQQESRSKTAGRRFTLKGRGGAPEITLPYLSGYYSKHNHGARVGRRG